MRHLCCILPLVLALGACADAESPTGVLEPAISHLEAEPATAMEHEHYNERFPLEFTTVSPCTGEEVFVEGTLHVMTQAVTDGTTTRLVFHSNQHYSGISASGTRYNIITVSHSVESEDLEDGSFSIIAVGNHRVIASGREDDFHMWTRNHIRFDGESFVVEKEDAGAECR